MAIYDLNGNVLATDGGSAAVDDAAGLMLYPFPVLRTASALKTSGCTLQTSGSTVTLTGNATGYAAFEIPVSSVESQMVRFTAGCTISSGGMKLQLAGVKKNSTSNLVLDVATAAAGALDQSIDLAWYDVYSTLDMAKPVELRLVLTAASSSIQLENPVLLQKAFECSFVAESGDTLGHTLENIDTAVRANSNTGGSDNVYSGPDGTKYTLQVSASGTAVFVPVVPKKALFIGNSLLLGFGQFGMCASNAQSDYYYHVTQAILAKNASFTASKVGGTSLESVTSDSAQDTAYANISSKLSSDLDLVVIQLSDNTNGSESIAYLTTGGGAKRLLTKIRTACPKARVVWAAAWYSTTAKLTAIQQACADTGCVFVDFSDLRTAENQGAIGNTITYPDGSTSTVEASGVASHPGDKGMKAIAQRILDKLGLADSTASQSAEATVPAAFSLADAQPADTALYRMPGQALFSGKGDCIRTGLCPLNGQDFTLVLAADGLPCGEDKVLAACCPADGSAPVLELSTCSTGGKLMLQHRILSKSYCIHVDASAPYSIRYVLTYTAATRRFSLRLSDGQTTFRWSASAATAPDAVLTLGGALQTGRSWHGTLQEVAVYAHAFTTEEMDNYLKGICDD